jgi:hypothetical protein
MEFADSPIIQSGTGCFNEAPADLPGNFAHVPGFRTLEGQLQ